MLLSLDHVIIRSATPAETLAQLAERAGAPILAHVEDVRGMASGIVRAGTVDIEVLRLGDDPGSTRCVSSAVSTRTVSVWPPA